MIFARRMLLVLVITAGLVSPLIATTAGAFPPYGAKLTAVSCVSSSFCRAGSNDGRVWAWDGSRWSVATHVGTGPVVIEDLVCTSTSFCMLTYDSGVNGGRYQGTAHWQDGRWTDQPFLLDGTWALSCNYHGFCVEILSYGRRNDDGVYSTGYRIWNGSRWSAVTTSHAFDRAGSVDGGVRGIDCYSSSNCSVIDGAGKIEAWNGSAWRIEHAYSTSSAIHFDSGIDCPTSTFCAGVADDKAFLRRNGVWGASQVLTSARFTSVSCASAYYCVAVTTTGSTHIWNGSRWVIGQHLDSSASRRAVDVSCPKSFSCHAVTLDGGVYRRGSAGTWHRTFHV